MKNIKPRDMQVFEILEEISNIKSDDLKVKTLQEKYYDHTPLHRILKMSYCSSIIPMLPEGTPPFNRNDNPDGPNHTSLWEYIRIFPVIVRSAQSIKMRPLQIERSFIEMLEAVDANEADVVCKAKDKVIQNFGKHGLQYVTEMTETYVIKFPATMVKNLNADVWNNEILTLFFRKQ